MILGSLPAAADPPTTRVAERVDPILSGNKESVAAAYRDRFLPAMAVASSAPDPAQLAGCQAGQPSADLQAATLQLVNYFRAMSQVQPVTFDEALSAKAQQAALMMYANNQLDHTPPTTWTCYSAAGAEAAGSANLALGYAGASVIKGYLDDPGASNVATGHRWWIQRPAARTMGSGMVGKAHALWVAGNEPAVSTPTYTSWPSAGFFPAQLEPAGRWSFTATSSSSDLRSATVTVTDSRGNPLRTTAYPVGSPGSLVFEVGALPDPGSAVEDYRVSISNILVDGRPIAPYGYTVSMFDPTSLTATSVPTITGAARVGDTLVARGPTWSEPSVTTTYRWLRDGAPIAGAASDRLLLGAADVGRRISVEATGTKSGFTSTTVRSVPSSPVMKISAALELTGRSTRRGDLQIDVVVASSEPKLGGTVTIREGARTVASGVKVTDGRAAFRAGGVAAGSHTYAVSYLGTARVGTASAVVKVVVAAKTKPTLTLAASSPAVARVKITIAVTAAGESALGGTVTVKEGSKTLAGLTVIRGQATFESSRITPGRHTYTVSYGGTSRVEATSRSVAVSVRAKTASTTSLIGSSPSANKITIVIAVQAKGQPALGGTAKVQEGSKILKADVKITGGKATYTATGITPGNHTYQVSYSGTSEVNGSSAKVTIQVQKPVQLTSYEDCNALRQDYPHGVGRTNAQDQTSGQPVTNFFKHDALYSYNDGAPRQPGEHDLDRDNDGIACETP